MGTNDGTSGTAEISKRYPIKADATYDDPMYLIPEEGSLVPQREKEGLDGRKG
jgi:hypothetical protein